MSRWHSPQVSDWVKKSAGMMPPTLVLAEDGKNGDFGPPPSSLIDAGTIVGLWMRIAGSGCARRQAVIAIGTTSSAAATATLARSSRRHTPPAPPPPAPPLFRYQRPPR